MNDMNNMNNMNMNNMNMNNMNMNMNMNPMMMNNMNMNPMMMNNMNMNMNPMMMQMMMNNPMMMQMMMGNNNMGMGNMGMGNMQNMGNANMDSQDPNSWNLIFEKKNGGQTINIRISSDSKVITAINTYKLKANMTSDDDAKFIFNGKQLNVELTLAESGLINGSKITVISIKDVEGA